LLDAAEVFEETFLADAGVLKTLEIGVFARIGRRGKKREGETFVRRMTPLEKALYTFITRCRAKKGERYEMKKLAEGFLWDFLIYPSLGYVRPEGDPPLGLRAGWVIVKKPVRPI